MFIHYDLIEKLVWLVVIGSKKNCKCTLLVGHQWGMIWMIWIHFDSNGNYVLGTRKHGNARFGVDETNCKK